MKKFLLIILFLTGVQGYSQTTDSLRLKLDDIFFYIDKSQIPSGYLVEYGAEFSPLHFFNGILTDSNVVGSLDNFRFIYTDVETAKIHSSAPSLLPLETVNNLIDSSKASGKSALVFLACNYASLKPSALTDGLFTWKKDRLYDVAGRTSSPYLDNLLFAAAATTPDFLNTVTLNYEPTIIFTNNSTTLQNVFVDFQNGEGFQLLTIAGISHTYTDSTGLKEIIVKAETNTGQFLYCKTMLHVTVDGGNANRYMDTDPYAKEVLIKNLPNAAGYFDFQDRLQIRYSVQNPTRELSVNNRHLRKPIIYVEGYDISGKNGLDYPLPVYTHGKLGYNLLDLISTNTDPKETGEWIKLANLPGVNYDLMNNLDNIAGYDLVFVNYNTLRSIEDNANMLRRVIEWVNADKAVISSTEKNVVVGVSMGGLVARYCLANMTKISYNSTDTKLLITHDSPHQGSNVPLSLQYFLYDLGYTKILGNRIKDSKDDIKDFMDLNENGESTAQLLRARAVYNNGNVETAYNSFLLPGGIYQQMVDIPPSQRPYRFVATAQGSQCGVPVSGSNIVYAHQNGSFGNLAFLSLGYLATNQSIPWLQGWGQKFKLITELKSLPFSGVQQIEYYKLTKKVSIFGIGLFNIGITERTRHNPNGFNDWDNIPGGTQSILSRGGTALIEGPQKATAFPVNLFVQGKAGLSLIIPNDLFCFVSTTSALDAPPGVDPYSTFSYGINGNLNTRIDNYISQEFYAGAYNQNHTDYTPRNAKWMYEEMESIVHDDGCQSDCPSNIGYSISGSELICGTNGYSVSGLNSSLSVAGWSVTPSNIVTSTVQGNSITLTAISNASGFITLSAAVKAAGCNAANPITKQIYVGKPQPVVTIQEFNETNSSCHVIKKIRLKSTNILTTYNWISACQLPTVGSFTNMSSGVIRTITQINPCGGDDDGQFKTRVDATNACGTTQGTVEKTINFSNVIEYDQDCLNPNVSTSNNYFITITPNPVTSYASIRLKYLPPPDPQGPTPSLNMIKIMLFNGSNQLLFYSPLSNVSEYTLSTSYLTPGFYRLLVQSASGEWLQNTIVK